jgi:type III secretory pathway component EscU
MLDDDTPTEGRSLSTRFHPRTLDELIEDPIPLTVTEPPGPANVSTLRPKARSLHAVLVESLNSTQALLRRLESGVTVPKDQQREIVRLLYVATRHQVKALTACLELDGLE